MTGAAVPSVWFVLLPFVAVACLVLLVGLLRGRGWPRPARRPAAPGRRRGELGAALLLAFACLAAGLACGAACVYLWFVGGLSRLNWPGLLAAWCVVSAAAGCVWARARRPHG